MTRRHARTERAQILAGSGLTTLIILAKHFYYEHEKRLGSITNSSSVDTVSALGECWRVLTGLAWCISRSPAGSPFSRAETQAAASSPQSHTCTMGLHWDYSRAAHLAAAAQHGRLVEGAGGALGLPVGGEGEGERGGAVRGGEPHHPALHLQPHQAQPGEGVGVPHLPTIAQISHCTSYIRHKCN